MTERWRKKLGDLDKQGPSDDVFDLAKHGPRHADDPLPGMRPSTRIATAVAAFAVFALAISVFAIPALRMQNTEAGSSSGGMFPLWPSQTTDQLKQLQSDAEAGNAAWALGPRSVAGRFADQVLGWKGASVLGVIQPECLGVDIPSAIAPASQIFQPDPGIASNISASAISGVGICEATTSASWVGPESAGPTSEPNTAFHTFGLVDSPRSCDPSIPMGCPGSIVQQYVTVYQPLAQGSGQIWAVLSAQNTMLKLSTVTGQTVRSGATVSGTFIGGGRPMSTLGYASCGVSRASSRADASYMMGPTIAITTDRQSSADCSGPQAGYVWAVRANESLADANGAPSPDPIASGAPLFGITAVSIVMVFPEEGPSTPPPNGGSDGIPTPEGTSPPTATTAGWDSVTGYEGWTMDVPSGWRSEKIAATSVTGSGGSGQELTGDGLTVDVFHGTEIVMPADDSTFPLDYDTLLSELNNGVLVGTFRGDGWPLDIRITPDGSKVTPEQEAILRRMVTSIGFPHIQPGRVLLGHPAFADPVAQDQWMEAGGRTFILKGTSDGYIALGPVTCREGGQVHTRWDPSQACPDSVNLTQWSANGTPAAGNAPGFQDPLPVHPVIRAWDGTLLALLEFGGGGSHDTSSVSPSPAP